MGKAIGIDLGTTNSVVAYKKNTTTRVIGTGPNAEDLCRSCVAIDPSGSVVVGNEAYMNWRRYAPNIAISVKRLMGASISDPQVKMMKGDHSMYPCDISQQRGGTEDSLALTLRGQEFTPEQISAQVLRQLKDDASLKLGEEVTHAVITVPAYFSEKQKNATRRAAEMAGLKVQRLLAEPTAAAISYVSQMQNNDGKIFLVYDFGGGTFDLSILVASGNQFIESGCSGDRWLGGDDIDRIVSEYVLAEASRQYKRDLHKLIDALPERRRHAFQGDFRNEVERAKKALSQVSAVTISNYDYLEMEDGTPVDIEVTLTRDQLEEMIRPIIQRTIDLVDTLLASSAYPISSIDHILLVGGSSCIPLVRKMLGDRYGADKILMSEKPMLSVAEGAAILADAIGEEYECPQCGHLLQANERECPVCNHIIETQQQRSTSNPTSIVYTTKHRYFIEIKDENDRATRQMIIDRGTVLPYNAYKKFYTKVENQKIIAVKLYSDAEDGGMEKIGTGYFTITENLPAHSELQFTFSLTQDEIMSVRVRVVATDKVHKINYSRGTLDTHCYDTLQSAFDTVVEDTEISDIKKEDFIAKLQRIIEGVEYEELLPNDPKWPRIEKDVIAAQMAAMTKNVSDNINFTIAKVLLNYFGNFLRKDHKDAMETGIAQYERAVSKFQKDKTADELEQVNQNYNIFVSAFLLILAGHYESDPEKANKALAAYDQFMDAANQGMLQRARDILAANEELISNVKLPTIITSTDLTVINTLHKEGD